MVKFRAVAKALGISQVAARSRLHRARRRALQALQAGTSSVTEHPIWLSPSKENLS
jgi:hypothetical protein